MALFDGFGISRPFRIMVELIGDDCLPAFVHVHMAHDLFPWLVKPCQRFKRAPAIGLGLEGKPRLAFRRDEVASQVEGRSAG